MAIINSVIPETKSNNDLVDGCINFIKNNNGIIVLVDYDYNNDKNKGDYYVLSKEPGMYNDVIYDQDGTINCVRGYFFQVACGGKNQYFIGFQGAAGFYDIRKVNEPDVFKKVQALRKLCKSKEKSTNSEKIEATEQQLLTDRVLWLQKMAQEYK